ncbi:MAG: TetR/AcrR family transcriptional regulator [Rubrimonas sp.]|uniref:TetR/AcrR family transcriptional regulator n=1 Tax=Rubrimonas sp. TaxID=2036015 RepID=UPI002FDD5571
MSHAVQIPQFWRAFNSLMGILRAMPRDSAETRQRILNGAYALFYRQGFERTGVDAVAVAAGVTKRTLYNHFASKDDLLAEVLAGQARFAAKEIRRWCGDEPRTAEDLVGAVFGGLREWSRSPDWRGSGFTRAAMELAWAPGHPVRRAAATQKSAVERALSDALLKAGAVESDRLARALVVLIEGAMTLRLIHGDPLWFDVAEDSARTLVQSTVSG